MGDVGVACEGADDEPAVGCRFNLVERKAVDVDELVGRSTLSFIRSIRVVPPATKRIWRRVALCGDLAPRLMAWSTVVGRLKLEGIHFYAPIWVGSLTDVRLGLFAGGLHGCDDVGIGAAAADIAVHGLLDVLVCRAHGSLSRATADMIWPEVQ